MPDTRQPGDPTFRPGTGPFGRAKVRHGVGASYRGTRRAADPPAEPRGVTPESVVLAGDCLELLPTLDAESIDAIATDPPYGLEFMGRAWDTFRVDERSARSKPVELRAFQNWVEQWAAELYRVAKPGAHLLAFGGTRTYHRLACGIEEAGWEVRDCLVWGYASGFPKSMDVSRQMDKRAGVEREKVPIGNPIKRMIPGADQNATGSWIKDNGREYQPGVDEPVSPEAIAWRGWGTALKPAWEPIILARKPLTGSVAENVLRFGTGALNIDATRIPVPPGDPVAEAVYVDRPSMIYGNGQGIPSKSEDGRNRMAPPEGGRWPANIILTDPIFDGDAEGVIGGGEQRGGGNPARQLGDGDRVAYGRYVAEGGRETGKAPVDTAGSYSRFFLVPKADRGEPVLRGQLGQEFTPTMGNGIGAREHDPADPRAYRENNHPTVKPVELMRHLVRLVTPPGGLVLDPFLGSGTTAVAAENEGFRWLGIERDPEYVAIAEARLNGTQRGLGLA